MNYYSNVEICQTINGIFKLDISVKDLQECKPEFVQKVYTLIIKDFGGSLEKLNQVPMNAPIAIHQYPEMFRGICFLVSLTKTIQYYLKLIYQTTDFQLKDLTMPDCQRTNKFFSQFLIFYLYIWENIDDYEGIESEAVAEREKVNMLQERVKGLWEERKQKEMENAELELHHKKVMDQLLRMKEEVEKVQELKNSFRAQLANVKEEINMKELEIKDLEVKLLEGKEELSKVKAQVLQDEEVAEMKEAKSKLTELEESNNELMENLKDLKLTLKKTNDSEQMVSSTFLPALQDIEKETNKKRLANAATKENLASSSRLMEKLEDLTHHHSQLLERNRFLKENHSQMKASKELMKTGLEEEIKRLQIHKEEILDTKRKAKDEEVKVVEELDRVHCDTQKLKEDLKTFVEEIEKQYRQVMVQIRKEGSLDLPSQLLGREDSSLDQ